MGRAQKNRKIKVKFYNPRDFTKDKHKRIDNIPYGGGPGMIMMAEPIIAAHKKAKGKLKKFKTIILAISGKKFTNKIAEDYSKKYKDIIIICGRYEGIDARVKKMLKLEEISIGDYTLTGGELAAGIIVDVITRRIKGVLGKDESVEERRISSGEVYTRPDILKYGGKNYKVPTVLVSGHHKKIEEWRLKKRKKL